MADIIHENLAFLSNNIWTIFEQTGNHEHPNGHWFSVCGLLFKGVSCYFACVVKNSWTQMWTCVHNSWFRDHSRIRVLMVGRSISSSLVHRTFVRRWSISEHTFRLNMKRFVLDLTVDFSIWCIVKSEYKFLVLQDLSNHDQSIIDSSREHFSSYY